MASGLKFCKLGKNAEDIFKDLKQSYINDSGYYSGLALKSGIKFVALPESLKDLNSRNLNAIKKLELSNYIDELLEEDEYGDKYVQMFVLEIKNFKEDLNLYYFFGFVSD